MVIYPSVQSNWRLDIIHIWKLEKVSGHKERGRPISKMPLDLIVTLMMMMLMMVSGCPSVCLTWDGNGYYSEWLNVCSYLLNRMIRNEYKNKYLQKIITQSQKGRGTFVHCWTWKLEMYVTSNHSVKLLSRTKLLTMRSRKFNRRPFVIGSRQMVSG